MSEVKWKINLTMNLIIALNAVQLCYIPTNLAHSVIQSITMLI